MFRWKLIGILSTALIVIAIPLSIVKHQYRAGQPQSVAAVDFTGTEKCRTCHQPEYELWKVSNHYHAMEVASETSVRGDFNNATFERFGIVSRFYQKDGRYFVHTQGPDGVMGDFEITHTFGWNPLQQYLIPFPGGRMQCLPIAWDVKGKKWYHLYPDHPIAPKDWQYWTNAAMNWNGMCATCHSTNLRKNYNIKTDTYQTTWSDINVGCEACHGPGSRHVKWAELPDMARPKVENFDLAVRTSGLKSRELVELCAPCHSRRAILGDYTHIEKNLLDTMLPSLLTRDLYFPDGQILEEVYAYASFTQSKMYARDVRCSDCHNVHSIKLAKEGNSLCLQCHRASDYDTSQHHFHKKKGEKGDPIKSADGKVLAEVRIRGRVRPMPHAGPLLYGSPLPAGSQHPDSPAGSRYQARGAGRLHPLPCGQNQALVRRNHYQVVWTGAPVPLRRDPPGRPQPSAWSCRRLDTPGSRPALSGNRSRNRVGTSGCIPGREQRRSAGAGADGHRSADPTHGVKPFADKPTRNTAPG